MSDALGRYKAFVDGVVAQASRSLKAQRLTSGMSSGFAEVSQIEIDELTRGLSPDQIELLARIIQSAHQDGVHQTLWFLNERISNGLRLVQDGVEFPVEPFERMNYDWLCRMHGDDWPDERGDVAI